MIVSDKMIEDVAAILARDRYSAGVTNEALAARVLATASLSADKPAPAKKPAKKKATSE